VGEEYQDDVNLWCSIALFLFGNADQTLPGGYSSNELDDKSPIKLVTSLRQELVLLGRATVLLKGIAKKLEAPLSLADKWGPGCALTMDAASEPSLPLWGKDVEVVLVKQIRSKEKSSRFVERVVKKLPPTWKAQVVEAELRRQERKDLAMKDKTRSAR
jgi:hypothetical protein